MAETTGNPITGLQADLMMLVANGTVTAITAKVQSVRQEKDANKIREVYDAAIQQLIAERSEAIQIAQALQSELDRTTISDSDMESLDATIGKLIDIFLPEGQGNEEGIADNRNLSGRRESFEQLRALINADTLKCMQLLGFNYKEAIGEPLTQMCASAIRSWGKPRKGSAQQSKRRGK